MSSLKTLVALAQFVSILAAERARTMTANEVAGITAILPLWKEGQYEAGSIVQHGGQPWRCREAHDSVGNPAWCPGAMPNLWESYHATTLERALPYVVSDNYNKGEYMIWVDGAIYLCNEDMTASGPDVLPSAWEKVADPMPEQTEEPEEEVPEITPYVEEGDSLLT